MMRTDITLLDIPSTLQNPVSPHTWKVRMILNYKRLAYRHQWVPTTQIEATCKALGIGPTGKRPDGSAHYTLPAIVDRTDPSRPVALSDSTPIAEYLERTYPAPTPESALFPPGTRDMQIQFNQAEIMRIVRMVPDIAVNAHLASKIEGDKALFRKKFEGLYGKPFEQIEKRGEEREAVWINLEQQFRRLGGMIDKHPSGEFLMGEHVRFADFALCGAMMFYRCLSPDEGWMRICSWQGGRWARYFDAFQEWMKL